MKKNLLSVFFLLSLGLFMSCASTEQSRETTEDYSKQRSQHFNRVLNNRI